VTSRIAGGTMLVYSRWYMVYIVYYECGSACSLRWCCALLLAAQSGQVV